MLEPDKIRELYLLRPIIRAFAQSVTRDWQDLNDKETHDRYHQLYDMVKEIVDDPKFKSYVQPIYYWSTSGGSSRMWKEHAVTILNSAKQLLAYMCQGSQHRERGRLTTS